MTEEFDEDVVFEVRITAGIFNFFLLETYGCFVTPPEF